MFWRLTLTYGLLVLIAGGLLGVVLISHAEAEELIQSRDSLRVTALLVMEALPSNEKDLQPRITHLAKKTGLRMTVKTTDGQILADSAGLPEPDTLSQPFSSITITLPISDLGSAAFLTVGPSGEYHDRLSNTRRMVWGAVLLTTLSVLAPAAVLARRFLQPLHDLTDGARRITAGGYGHQVFSRGSGEVGTLARTFNAMSERLAGQFAQLEADREQLRAILSGMIEGVVAIDPDQRVRFANERAAQLLDFPLEAAVGRKLYEVVRQRQVQEIVDRALAGDSPGRQELHSQGPNSRTLDLYVARLPGPPAHGAILVLHDTTELRRLERMRQEFVANVSHELKTPLSVIKACVESLLDGAIDDPAHRGSFLEQIDDQADRLHNLILDLLRLARIEGGIEALEFTPVDMRAAVEDCIDRHRPRSEAKNIDLIPVAPAGGFTVTAWAEDEAVGQILDNLVDNALKYTPAGGRIQVRWGLGNEDVWVEVEDTGIGIPERDLPRIFERFYRVDKARSRELGGTGLGLSIVKHLAQLMKGSVRASSRVGQGTTFTVTLPRALEA